ncbi:MAG: serine/threonine-protein kinase [Acidobacteria bacterium]|nr:serine/threonine-protein kinase [Acidobacteriota bacterium]
MVGEIQAGMEVGRYRLERRLATGGMGTVWIARDRLLVREVAVKLLPRLFVTDEAAEQRFQREARAMGRIQHPNVVSIFDIGSADPGSGEEVPYLVMELIRGRSLDQIIKEGPLPARRAVGIAAQVAKALGAAHRAGVVHRDLKPSNIVISDEGHAKVLDFGLARLVQAIGHSSEATLTAPGMVLGSCPYMAPEQALGGHVGAHADIFSFGTVLYEMVTGRRAFTGTTPVQVLQSVIKCQYPSIAEVAVGAPPALAAIIERCLEKDPGRRYPDADSLVHDLEAFLGTSMADDGDIPTVGLGSSSIRAVEIQRRRRLIRAGLAAAVVLVIGTTGGLLGGRAGMESLRPDPGRWRSRTLHEGTGSIRHISWSPSGTELVAEVEDNGAFEILVVPVDQQEPRVLAQSSEDGAPIWPAYSPDGQAVAVTRMGDTSMSVEILPAVGGAAVSVLDNASRGAWIAPGTLVVSRITEGTSDLWTWEPNTGQVTPYPVSPADRQYWAALPRPGGGAAFLGGGSDTRAGIFVGWTGRDAVDQWLAGGILLQGLSWHPEGRSLVASVGHRIARVTESGRADLLAPPLTLDYPAFDGSGTRLAVVDQHSSYDIVAADPLTGRLRCVKCGEPKVGWGSVGPETSIFYRRSVDGGPSLYRVDRNSGDEGPVAAAGPGASCPVVSPDGTRLTYLKRNVEAGGVDLMVLALAGGEPVTLATAVEGSEFPSWSPDGRFVAFAAGSPLRVWVVSAAGGDPRAVSPPGGDYPVWSPDGRWIAFSIWTDGGDANQGAWLVSPQGSSPFKINSHPTRLAWSRDGKDLYQLRREQESIVVYSAEAGRKEWHRSAVLKLDGPVPEHFEYLPLTVDPATGELILNRNISRSALLVFEELDPKRW